MPIEGEDAPMPVDAPVQPEMPAGGEFPDPDPNL